MPSSANALFGRRVLISGSASPRTGSELIRYSHKIVEGLAGRVLEQGGGLVCAAGREPRKDPASALSPTLTFDWTVLESCSKSFTSGQVHWPVGLGPPLVVVLSEKSEREIPQERRPLWDLLLRSGLMRVESIQPGARSGAMIRQRQADFAAILVTVGGGTGVEHLADLFISRHRPVIPLDLSIGASREDGLGGSERLASLARAEVNKFFRLQAAVNEVAGSFLVAASTRGGKADSEEVVKALVKLLSYLERPIAFYVRLLDPDHPAFARVEDFFRNVVDSVVAGFGYSRIEVGRDRAQHAFINVEIFETLHFAELAIVDITGSRPNCFIELGYALGRVRRVLVTAEKGTELPFDQKAIPCLFWCYGEEDEARRKAFINFSSLQIDRPPIVRA